jgi:hypothetical protein
MIEDGIRRIRLTTSEWGEVLVLRTTPDPDPWGSLKCLRGTPWGDLISTVSGESMSHALHGYATPLMREIGRDPRALRNLVPEDVRLCHQIDECIMANEKTCHPCRLVPQCYRAPSKDPEIQIAGGVVVLSWAEDRYVLVVEGSEFSL